MLILCVYSCWKIDWMNFILNSETVLTALFSLFSLSNSLYSHLNCKTMVRKRVSIEMLTFESLNWISQLVVLSKSKSMWFNVQDNGWCSHSLEWILYIRIQRKQSRKTIVHAWKNFSLNFIYVICRNWSCEWERASERDPIQTALQTSVLP